MADLFTTGVLTAVVQDLKTPSSFLLDRYFPNEQRETTEEIHFDLESNKRRIAPFVSPLVAGRVVQGAGYTTKTFKPAYVKDNRVFDPSRPMKRAIGEQIGGSLTPMDRIRATLAYELADQVNNLTRRMVVMASEALRLGQVTVEGEGYPSQLVDYGRDSTLSPTDLSGANTWDTTDVDPLDDLQDWALAVLQKSGAKSTDVIMAVDVWKVFRKKDSVKAELDRFRGNSTMVTDAQLQQGATFMGVVNGFNIFVYSDWYVDDDGNETAIWPDGQVALTGSQLEGVRAYGAIRDEEAGYQALPYFPKSWVEKDPAVRYLLMQSAPLPVPYRINASYARKVM